MADRWIGIALQNGPAWPSETQHMAIGAKDANHEELWTVSLSVTRLTGDVYLATCSGKRQ
jgi:hypothetical protein